MLQLTEPAFRHIDNGQWERKQGVIFPDHGPLSDDLRGRLMVALAKTAGIPPVKVHNPLGRPLGIAQGPSGCVIMLRLTASFPSKEEAQSGDVDSAFSGTLERLDRTFETIING